MIQESIHDVINKEWKKEKELRPNRDQYSFLKKLITKLLKGTDYREKIEEMDITQFKYLHNTKTDKYYLYSEFTQRQDTQSNTPVSKKTDEIEGLNIVFLSPDEKKLSELYVTCLISENKGIDVKELDELTDLLKAVRPCFPIEGLSSTNTNIEWKNYKISFIRFKTGVPYVRLISPNIKDDSVKHPYDVGLYKSQSEPTIIYETLLQFAFHGNPLNPHDINQIKMNTYSQRIRRTNEWLMEKFDINVKPILPFSKKIIGYRCKINITYEEQKGGEDAMEHTDMNYDNPEKDYVDNDLYGDDIDSDVSLD